MNVFVQGQHLNSDDLNIEITDDNGQYIDPYTIVYSIYGKYENKGYNGSDLYTVGSIFRDPTKLEVGKYYVSGKINSAFLVGSYVVQWAVRREENSPLEIVGEFEFSVVRN